ncbi:MAG: hypothetical protein AB7T49_02970 [Oligoflexales bacterium]
MRIAFVTQNYLSQPHAWSNILAKNYLSAIQAEYQVHVLTTELKASGKSDGNILSFEGVTPKSGEIYLAYAEETGVSVADVRSFSRELIDHLIDKVDSYDLVCFFHDNFSPLWLGLPQVAPKAVLFTCWEKRQTETLVTRYSPFFHSLKGLCFFGEEDRDNFERLYPIPKHICTSTVGWTVMEPALQEASHESKSLITICTDDNSRDRTQEALQCIEEVRTDYNIPTEVDVLTPKASSHQAPPSIENSRAVVLAGGDSQISHLFDAWLRHKPVIIPGDSEKMRHFCEKSGGGMYYNSKAMLRGLIAWTLCYESESATIGDSGYEYVVGTNGQLLIQEFFKTLLKGNRK